VGAFHEGSYNDIHAHNLDVYSACLMDRVGGEVEGYRQAEVGMGQDRGGDNGIGKKGILACMCAKNWQKQEEDLCV
jgi:hypothetical protein